MPFLSALSRSGTRRTVWQWLTIWRLDLSQTVRSYAGNGNSLHRQIMMRFKKLQFTTSCSGTGNLSVSTGLANLDEISTRHLPVREGRNSLITPETCPFPMFQSAPSHLGRGNPLPDPPPPEPPLSQSTPSRSGRGKATRTRPSRSSVKSFNPPHPVQKWETATTTSRPQAPTSFNPPHPVR